MRWCRYSPCGKPFQPKPGREHFRYCSWEHYLADGGKDYERDRRGDRRAYEQHYDAGFWDGNRARPADLDIPYGIWNGLLLFSHPDKWQGEPGLLTLANEVTRWLLEHRPKARTP